MLPVRVAAGAHREQAHACIGQSIMSDEWYVEGAAPWQQAVACDLSSTGQRVAHIVEIAATPYWLGLLKHKLQRHQGPRKCVLMRH